MVQDIQSLTVILNAINGKLRTPKIGGVHALIDDIKHRDRTFRSSSLVKLPLNTSSLNSNAWLAGFIDAKGHFAIKGFTENPKSHLAIQFYLSQRRTDRSGVSLEKVMLQIAEFLSTKLGQRVISDRYEQFIANTSNAKSNKILIDYLNIFPILSSKYLDYKD